MTRAQMMTSHCLGPYRQREQKTRTKKNSPCKAQMTRHVIWALVLCTLLLLLPLPSLLSMWQQQQLWWWWWCVVWCGVVEVWWKCGGVVAALAWEVMVIAAPFFSHRVFQYY
jgi:sterol desaturase/sphingolipid hydroxylase (fatty acid hydroxylase superfamily)